MIITLKDGSSKEYAEAMRLQKISVKDLHVLHAPVKWMERLLI